MKFLAGNIGEKIEKTEFPFQTEYLNVRMIYVFCGYFQLARSGFCGDFGRTFAGSIDKFRLDIPGNGTFESTAVNISVKHDAIRSKRLFESHREDTGRITAL